MASDLDLKLSNLVAWASQDKAFRNYPTAKRAIDSFLDAWWDLYPHEYNIYHTKYKAAGHKMLVAYIKSTKYTSDTPHVLAVANNKFSGKRIPNLIQVPVPKPKKKKGRTVNEEGRTSCCGAMTSIDEYGVEYCKKCYLPITGRSTKGRKPPVPNGGPSHTRGGPTRRDASGREASGKETKRWMMEDI